jgi:hypothetical protein
MNIITAKTYSKDYDLFAKLGFKRFSIDDQFKTLIGTYSFDDESFIKVWVTCFPAQFWHFEIYCAEVDKTYYFATGSGCLSDYWNSIELIATGMLCQSNDDFDN